MPVFCEKQGYKLRMNGFVASEVTAEETADQITVNRGVISGEMYVFDRTEEALEIISEFLYLGGFSCSVQTFKYYQHVIKCLACKYTILVIFADMNSNRKIDIMAIVNLTDDSYYAPSRCLDSDPVSSAMQRIRALIAEGADIIDLGACSTRPGSEPVGAEEEWRRLKPVLEAVVSENPTVRISIDTYHSYVIRNAYEFLSSVIGEDSVRSILIVNDISAGEDDPQMLSLVGRLGLGYIAMHKRGDSKTMQSLTDYDDVVEEVKTYFDEFASKAASAGIRDWVLDPGFGFAKNVEQNYALLRGLDSLKTCGSPSGNRRILVGVSRKSMIYKYLDITPEESLSATQVLHLKSLQNGADILRVHDVAEAVRTVKLYRVLR